MPALVQVGVDYYALSFVRDAGVIYELKQYLAAEGEGEPSKNVKAKELDLEGTT